LRNLSIFVFSRKESGVYILSLYSCSAVFSQFWHYTIQCTKFVYPSKLEIPPMTSRPSYALYVAYFYSSRVFILEQLHRMNRKGLGAPTTALTQGGIQQPRLWKTILLLYVSDGHEVFYIACSNKLSLDLLGQNRNNLFLHFPLETPTSFCCTNTVFQCNLCGNKQSSFPIEL
jgi:hypothetical protein